MERRGTNTNKQANKQTNDTTSPHLKHPTDRTHVRIGVARRFEADGHLFVHVGGQKLAETLPVEPVVPDLEEANLNVICKNMTSQSA